MADAYRSPDTDDQFIVAISIPVPKNSTSNTDDLCFSPPDTSIY